MTKRLRTALGLMLFVLLVGSALFFSNRPSAQQSSEPNELQNETLILGKTIYQANCASCHGAEGAGYAAVGIPAPAVNGSEHAWHHPDEQILALIRQGGNMMPAVGADWSDEELKAVWAYVKQWWTPQQRKSQLGTIGEYD